MKRLEMPMDANQRGEKIVDIATSEKEDDGGETTNLEQWKRFV